jgi:hypothetical protein
VEEFLKGITALREALEALAEMGPKG